MRSIPRRRADWRQRERSLDEVPAENDFSGERLLGLARHCANNHGRRIPFAPPGLADELTSFLVKQASRGAALRRCQVRQRLLADLEHVKQRLADALGADAGWSETMYLRLAAR